MLGAVCEFVGDLFGLVFDGELAGIQSVDTKVFGARLPDAEDAAVQLRERARGAPQDEDRTMDSGSGVSIGSVVLPDLCCGNPLSVHVPLFRSLDHDPSSRAVSTRTTRRL